MLDAGELGKPHLEIAGFELWVHGREFPEATDLDDGDWLRVTALCRAPGARFSIQGAILMATDIERFQQECSALLSGQATVARLAPLEPDLHLSIEAVDRQGHLRAEVNMAPDLSSSHSMQFKIDQSFLPGIVAACARILREHPVRRASG